MARGSFRGLLLVPLRPLKGFCRSSFKGSFQGSFKGPKKGPFKDSWLLGLGRGSGRWRDQGSGANCQGSRPRVLWFRGSGFGLRWAYLEVHG